MEKFKKLDWNFLQRFAKLCNFHSFTNEISYLQLWRRKHTIMIFAHDEYAYIEIKIKTNCPFLVNWQSILFNLPIQWRDPRKAKLNVYFDLFSKEITEEIRFKPKAVRNFDELDVMRIIETLDKRIPR